MTPLPSTSTALNAASTSRRGLRYALLAADLPHRRVAAAGALGVDRHAQPLLEAGDLGLRHEGERRHRRAVGGLHRQLAPRALQHRAKGVVRIERHRHLLVVPLPLVARHAAVAVAVRALEAAQEVLERLLARQVARPHRRVLARAVRLLEVVDGEEAARPVGVAPVEELEGAHREPAPHRAETAAHRAQELVVCHLAGAVAVKVREQQPDVVVRERQPVQGADLEERQVVRRRCRCGRRCGSGARGRGRRRQRRALAQRHAQLGEDLLELRIVGRVDVGDRLGPLDAPRERARRLLELR